MCDMESQCYLTYFTDTEESIASACNSFGTNAVSVGFEMSRVPSGEPRHFILVHE
jgi:hypothetical protein